MKFGAVTPLILFAVLAYVAAAAADGHHGLGSTLSTSRLPRRLLQTSSKAAAESDSAGDSKAENEGTAISVDVKQNTDQGVSSNPESPSDNQAATEGSSKAKSLEPKYEFPEADQAKTEQAEKATSGKNTTTGSSKSTADRKHGSKEAFSAEFSGKTSTDAKSGKKSAKEATTVGDQPSDKSDPDELGDEQDQEDGNLDGLNPEEEHEDEEDVPLGMPPNNAANGEKHPFAHAPPANAPAAGPKEAALTLAQLDEAIAKLPESDRKQQMEKEREDLIALRERVTADLQDAQEAKRNPGTRTGKDTSQSGGKTDKGDKQLNEGKRKEGKADAPSAPPSSEATTTGAQASPSKASPDTVAEKGNSASPIREEALHQDKGSKQSPQPTNQTLHATTAPAPPSATGAANSTADSPVSQTVNQTADQTAIGSPSLSHDGNQTAPQPSNSSSTSTSNTDDTTSSSNGANSEQQQAGDKQQNSNSTIISRSKQQLDQAKVTLDSVTGQNSTATEPAMGGEGDGEEGADEARQSLLNRLWGSMFGSRASPPSLKDFTPSSVHSSRWLLLASAALVLIVLAVVFFKLRGWGSPPATTPYHKVGEGAAASVSSGQGTEEEWQDDFGWDGAEDAAEAQTSPPQQAHSGKETDSEQRANSPEVRGSVRQTARPARPRRGDSWGSSDW